MKNSNNKNLNIYKDENPKLALKGIQLEKSRFENPCIGTEREKD